MRWSLVASSRRAPESWKCGLHPWQETKEDYYGQKWITKTNEWYRVNDAEVAARKVNSATLCQEFNAIPENEPAKQEAKTREIFGSAGKNLVVHSRLNVDYGKISMSGITF